MRFRWVPMQFVSSDRIECRWNHCASEVLQLSDKFINIVIRSNIKCLIIEKNKSVSYMITMTLQEILLQITWGFFIYFQLINSFFTVFLMSINYVKKKIILSGLNKFLEFFFNKKNINFMFCWILNCQIKVWKKSINK